MEPYERYEHAGVIVEIVQDDEPGGYGPQDHDNAGTIYSWTSGWDGDERVSEPDLMVQAEQTDQDYDQLEEIDLPRYMRDNYDAALTIPLRFSDYGSSGARLYEDDSDPNCALVFTQDEIDREWGTEPIAPVLARRYAEARIDELDMWMQGYVFGIVIRERNPAVEPENDGQGDVLESVWGFIGDPDASWIRGEADELAEACAEQVEHERQEVANWAARDVVTV